MDLRLRVFVEDELRDAFAIAQMDKDDSAQIAAAMHPAHEQALFCRHRKRATPRSYACVEGCLKNQEVRMALVFECVRSSCIARERHLLARRHVFY